MKNKTILAGVREYAEGYPVTLAEDGPENRLCVCAENEGGYNGTSVDLLDLIAWLKANRRDLLS